MLVAKRTLAEAEPAMLSKFVAAARQGLDPSLPQGRAAMQPAIDLVIRYAAAQGVIPRTLGPDEVWA